jgi:hypothetical protein
VERRQSERKRIAAIVYLRIPGRRLVWCEASNLSAGGTFIEVTPPAMRWGREVQLIFVLAIGGIIKLRRVPAVVARVCHDGAEMLLHSKLSLRRGAAPFRNSGLYIEAERYALHASCSL